MFPQSTRIVSLLSVVLLAGPGAVAQDLGTTKNVASERRERIGAGRAPDAPDAFALLVFEGFVLEPSGAPAVGAVVLTSAGGKALTDGLGRYRLEARVPRDAGAVQVTAVSAAGRNRVASASVELPAASRTARVDPLLLTEGATCAPRWLPTFGGEPGTSGIVLVLAVYDDGGGAALYAGGAFSSMGGVAATNIAKWDGSCWSPLGSGIGGNYDEVRTLTVFDDGGGEALYAGGQFRAAGGVAARNIAKWDGSSWSPLGSGIGGNYDYVRALTVFDDGGGEALFAGGDFTTAGGVTAYDLAKWDGSSWSSTGAGVGAGTNGTVYSLAAYDDGGGKALYAGRVYASATTAPLARRIAKWDGTTWTSLGSGIEGSGVFDLTVYDDGVGAALYVGGSFTRAGGVLAKNLAKWDGLSWSPLGNGQMVYGVDTLTVYDDGGGAALYAGGDFISVGGVAASRIAKWDGSSWSALGSGMELDVWAMTAYDDGGGAALFAGGRFTTAGSAEAKRIGKWDGSSWSAVSSEPRGINDAVHALAVFDDGGGRALYAGGVFDTVGGVTASRIAKWDGAGWSPLGSGIDGRVDALTVYDDGSGPALYVGGAFAMAGGVAASNIAKWDGSNWSPLGMGMDNGVVALVVHDDGGGAALYAGGYFTTAGSVTARWIAKWDGSSWSALGNETSGGVDALVVYDDGGGSALYAGGSFLIAGGLTAGGIAKWDGSSWSPLGSGMNDWVRALTVYDDGEGAVLYAAGRFTSAGGVTARGIARWNGSTWSPLGSGMTGTRCFLGCAYPTPVRALAPYDDGGGTALYAGGEFASAIDSGDSYLAKWSCPPPVSITSVTPLPRPGAGGIRK